MEIRPHVPSGRLQEIKSNEKLCDTSKSGRGRLPRGGLLREVPAIVL